MNDPLRRFTGDAADISDGRFFEVGGSCEWDGYGGETDVP